MKRLFWVVVCVIALTATSMSAPAVAVSRQKPSTPPSPTEFTCESVGLLPDCQPVVESGTTGPITLAAIVGSLQSNSCGPSTTPFVTTLLTVVAQVTTSALCV